MKIGVVGLGLIGGSIAKAFSSLENTEVLGYDKEKSVCLCAKLESAIKEDLTPQNISKCDYVIIALYPKDTIAWLKEFAPSISKSTIVIDCGGVKREICKKCFALSKKYGFRFVGGHPMAGTQFSGFKHSRASLFTGASMILVPDKQEKIETLEEVKSLFVSIGFKGITITSPEKHDKIIAYTSQLAHIVSSAYVKSPNSMVHKGFSAGSYKDMTRVAKLNPEMWTELFEANSENLVFEINHLIDELQNYRDAIENKDTEKLKSLLQEGTKIKESIG